MKTKRQLEEKVFSYIRKHHMLNAGDRVIAGVSGGADSVCLLFLLLEWAKHSPLEIAVVHINHGIRPEAGEDAAYVKSLCDLYQLPFYLTEADVQQRAEEEKCSEEDAGRRIRYEAFRQAAEEFEAAKIAVAHNCNDRSETMLFHLFRGSGIKGLGSIQPVRDCIIRPLLCLERHEIEAYLEAAGIAYCQDATNATDDYTRNRIRHHIIPYAEEHIVQGCVSHMAQTAEMLSEAEDFLEQQSLLALESCLLHRTDEEYEFSVERFLQLHPFLQKRILHGTLKHLSPIHKDISRVHIMDLLDLFTGEGNRMVNLPFNMIGKREYERVYVGIVEKMEQECPEELVLEMKVLSIQDIDKNTQELSTNQYTKWFDYDKIKGCLELRTRKVGDYLTISDGAGGVRHKSLKDYMINVKLPKEQREKIPIVAEEDHVLWVVGYRISEYYKISENTKHILQVQLISKKNTKSNGGKNG